MQPLISVVILTWNRKRDLLLALDSIYWQDYENKEIVLVDSASTDGTQEAILSRYPEVRYIRLPYNLGVIGGRNIGLANSRGEVIFFLDDDAELLDRHAFRKVVNRFACEPELAVLFSGFVLESGEPRGWVFPFQKTPELENRELYTSDFQGGICWMNRKWIDKIGYLKSEYFRDGEEGDYAYRIIAHGGRILYHPHIKVLHRLNPSQRVPAELQAYKFAHRTENDLIYLDFTEALLTLLWRLSSSFLRSLREGSINGYTLGCWRLFRALPRVIRTRQPLNRAELNLHRTLRCFAVSDYQRALSQNTRLIDWARVRTKRRHLGILEDLEPARSTSNGAT